MYFSQEASMCI